MAAPTESKRKAYRIGAWASAAVAFVAAVLTFAFGLAAVTGPGQAGDGSTASTQAGPRTTGALGEVLAADQAVVSGTVTSLVGTNIDAPALVLPVTLTVERGGGTKADFSGGTVAGKPATLSWDGGRPLTLSGQGSLDFNGPVNVEVTAAGATWSLDGSSRLLTAGTYIFGATVAVSLATNALGAPKDGARFDVAPGAAASLSTKGDVRITTAPAALTLKGPGRLTVEGTFDVRTKTGTRQARKITFGPGAFQVDLQPQPGGFGVDGALLQGPMTVDG